MGSFFVVGLAGAALTLGALGWCFPTKGFSAHWVLIPLAALTATVALGARADQVLAKAGRHSALWLGPACALGVLLAGALATVVSNLPDIPEDPESFALRPLLAVLLYGATPAVLAGLLCGAVVWVARGPR